MPQLVGGGEAAVPFPEISFTASGEALLKGKRPLLRLAVRAVRLLRLAESDAEEVVEIENVRGEASNAFCVATKRTEHDAKAEVPTLEDPVRCYLIFICFDASSSTSSLDGPPPDHLPLSLCL
jgi:hypothetical protein